MTKPDNGSMALDSRPWAHVTEEGTPHLLEDHLERVSELAASFAAQFGSASWARVAGLWHDLGKYTGQFQHMIRAENGLACHIEPPQNDYRDHSSAGAVHADGVLGPVGFSVSAAIAGHHGGLPDREDLRDRLSRRAVRLEDAVRAGPPDVVLRPTLPTGKPIEPAGVGARLRLDLHSRMLFSALCDADFLNTESFFRPESRSLREEWPAVPELRRRLAVALSSLEAEAPRTAVNDARARVRADCLHMAPSSPGVFSLTVPTGGGKTLASMQFALEHAVSHGLRRVVVAIPYTSIIEQNAEQFRRYLGANAVVEHHSALPPERDNPRNRIASENWDAPIVVTTNARLFDDLFSNRPGHCRRLHNLARSVIVLDEAQTLPPGLLAPILDVLKALVSDYGASLVLCTATQPALGASDRLPQGFPEVTEIVSQPEGLFAELRRTRIVWPATMAPTPWPDLAAKIAARPRVLAITHRRRDALELASLVEDAAPDALVFHLSASMCAEHRSRRLQEIRSQLDGGGPVRVISTQLVEAGVDLDFPVVYRAMGGFDAIAQAAGRCNREGRMTDPGEVRVFFAVTAPPPGVPRTAFDVATLGWEERERPDLLRPEAFRGFFRDLYGNRDLDENGIQKLRESLSFRRVAERFRFVDDASSVSVVVPYGEAPSLVGRLDREGPGRQLYRSLQRYLVNVPRHLLAAWSERGLARLAHDAVWVVDGPHMYDERYGLGLERAPEPPPSTFVL
jgi:CRISPR-associated endonuclease/helicase Cas3